MYSYKTRVERIVKVVVVNIECVVVGFFFFLQKMLFCVVALFIIVTVEREKEGGSI
jgi:hypothetical protein